jgi:putative DNA primase/helicase
MDKPATWFAEGQNAQSPEILRSIRDSSNQRMESARKAKEKADWILQQTCLEEHPYLERKGFAGEQGNVWERDGKRILVIPMRKNREVVGCQLIDSEGGKKFLQGQISKGATFTIGAKGVTIFCEGYATGLSIRQIMQKMNITCNIHICFSASNMEFVARDYGQGIIIADNDPNGVGQATAEKTGKPYWISETVGEDFNDYHVRVGHFKATQALKKKLLSYKI